MTSLSENTVVTTSGGLVELGYSQFWGNKTITSTTATAGDVVFSPISIVSDGSPIIVEFFAPNVYNSLVAGRYIAISLEIDGSQYQRYWGVKYQTGTTSDDHPMSLQYRLTLSAGVHTIGVRAHVNSGQSSIYSEAGAGGTYGASGYAPTFLRVSKVVQASQFIVPLASAPLVTSLPSAPIDGQEIRYVADATNGIIWNLRYRAASSSAYKWEFIGGPAYRSVVNLGNADESTTSTSYTNLATVGPDYQIVLPGDYEFYFDIESFRNDGGAGTDAYISYQAGSTNNAAENTRISNGSGQLVPGSMRRVVTGLSTGDYIQMKYKVSSSTGRFRGTRRLFVTPIRVG